MVAALEKRVSRHPATAPEMDETPGGPETGRPRPDTGRRSQSAMPPQGRDGTFPGQRRRGSWRQPTARIPLQVDVVICVHRQWEFHRS
ncbi:hypothetical protein T11_7386 [Trichinella zimbabwensis]|uniref:Uncharacterized protein n=1 Tax=Trichinella zimbabwensis TaxID=268475 RepID=A0A0V1I4G6_9BILA|nr:hypothetical protein T11_7386 [Trichinella zimbabwensis]